MSFTCPYGTIRELYEFGMQKVDNTSCKTNGYYIGEGGGWDDVQLDCNFEFGLTPEGK